MDDLAASPALSRYAGTLTFNPSLPDGQPRRSLDVSRAEQGSGLRATTTLEEGRRRTIEWFEPEGVTAAVRASSLDRRVRAQPTFPTNRRPRARGTVSVVE